MASELSKNFTTLLQYFILQRDNPCTFQFQVFTFSFVRPRSLNVPGSDLQNIFLLRSPEDANKIGLCLPEHVSFCFCFFYRIINDNYYHHLCLCLTLDYYLQHSNHHTSSPSISLFSFFTCTDVNSVILTVLHCLIFSSSWFCPRKECCDHWNIIYWYVYRMVPCFFSSHAFRLWQKQQK